MSNATKLVVVALVVAFGWLAVDDAAAAPTTMAYWKFDEFNGGGNHNLPADNFQVVDSSGNQNQLRTWDNNGYNYTSSTDLPAPALFAGSNNRSVVPDTTDLAVLFHSVSDNGNDLNFSGQSFTLEGCFKTSGDQSGAGRMEVLYNSQSNFSYLVNVNEAVPGQLRFATGGGPYPQVNLGGGVGTNYASGDWYYFIARYAEMGPGQQDQLSLFTYDQNGALIERGNALAPVGFDIAATTGNSSVGSVVHTTHFIGTLDEIRISRGLVEQQWQLNHVTEVAVDTFDNTHDYSASGVTGTVWDGLLNPGGATTIATSNSPTTAGDGNLQIAIPAANDVGFDSSHNNAPFLFQNVGGVDFDAQLVIDTTTYANYSAAGLMVRLADPLSDGIPGVNNGEDFLSLVYHNFGTPRNTIRSLNDGSQSDTNYNDGSIEEFLRVTRVGSMFSFYTRANDVDEWTLLTSLNRPDLLGDVQVGLWYGLFGANTGSAEFENFILYTYTPEPGTLTLLGLGLLALRRRARRRAA